MNLTTLDSSLIGLNKPISWQVPTTDAETMAFVGKDTEDRPQIHAEPGGQLHLRSKIGKPINFHSDGDSVGMSFVGGTLVLAERPKKSYHQGGIYRDGPDVFVNTGGRTVNLSALSGGEPLNTLPTAGGTKTGEELDKLFGAWTGAIGVHITDQFGTDSARTYIEVRIGNQWYRVEFSTDTITSDIGTESRYFYAPKRTINHLRIDKIPETVSEGLASIIGGLSEGKMFIITSGNRSSENRLVVSYKQSNGTFATILYPVTFSLNAGDRLEPELPFFSNITTFDTPADEVTGNYLNLTVGTHRGSIGVNTQTAKLYVKLTTAWWVA